MEDLFEKMMDSTQLKSSRRRRLKGRTRREVQEEEQLEGALMREALGGTFLGSGEKMDGSWLDLDHALAAKGTRMRQTEDDFETGWSGESYEGESESGVLEEGFSREDE